ncbi:MAG: hypothetical protein ACOYYF_01250 [Chloroflexota bacterium]|nr:hypothetical protein [Chloroflexota bacterium]MBI5703874.1 hypothetical protein [Chloroflexota bacterium]
MSPKIQRILVFGLITAGVLLAVFFGLRAAFAFHEFRRHSLHPFAPMEARNNQPVETDVELIRDWMTIPYIARTYRVPPEILFEALRLSPSKSLSEKSLKQLNDEYFPQAEGFVITTVKAAIVEFQAQAFPTATPSSPAVSPAP